MNRSLTVVIVSGALAPASLAGLVDTVDPGPLGPVGPPDTTIQDFLNTPATVLGGQTIGRVEVSFGGKGVRVDPVEDAQNPGVFFNGFGGARLEEAGFAPGFTNWVSDTTFGLLDQFGNTIGSVFSDDEVIAIAGEGLGNVGLAPGTVVYGYFVEFEDPMIGPLDVNAFLRATFAGKLTIVPAPASAALLGLGALATARRRR